MVNLTNKTYSVCTAGQVKIWSAHHGVPDEKTSIRGLLCFLFSIKGPIVQKRKNNVDVGRQEKRNWSPGHMTTKDVKLPFIKAFSH